MKGLNRRLSILYYHHWFKGFVTEWLRIAMSKARTKITNAIAVDQVKKKTAIHLVKSLASFFVYQVVFLFVFVVLF